MSSVAARALCIAMLASIPFASALAQDAQTTAVQAEARHWLANADTLDGDKSWRDAGDKFRNAITAQRWTEALAKAREPLGAVERRTAASTQFSKSLQGLPDGEYATIEFHTTFAHKAEAAEIVRLEHEPNGAWHVIGYFIR